MPSPTNLPAYAARFYRYLEGKDKGDESRKGAPVTSTGRRPHRASGRRSSLLAPLTAFSFLSLLRIFFRAGECEIGGLKHPSINQNMVAYFISLLKLYPYLFPVLPDTGDDIRRAACHGNLLFLLPTSHRTSFPHSLPRHLTASAIKQDLLLSI